MLMHVREANMYYNELGGGVPVLCLPAYPFNHVLFRGQEALREEARLILPDYRGTGRSTVPEGPYTLELLAEDMLALLDHLHAGPAVVLGVSMGVYVALTLYALQPDRFKGLILADSRAEADSPETAARRQRTVEELRRHGPGVLRQRVAELFGVTTLQRRPDLVETEQLELLQQPAAGLADLMLGLALRPDRRDLLPRISVPVLVLCGEEDTITPARDMRKLAAAIPDAEFHTIPHSGHLACLEQPAAFNRRVIEFLRRLPVS